ncbi:MAG: tRNA threonylcarbamoyladenosine dehydratase [Bacteroidaceae bacterium]|nr:tRNA threonylcarbamoyladenosine dehydratase [Bacteroidaceae bacterium]
MNENYFQRTELLIGSEAMQRLKCVKVILFGVGGVGSWCAESLIRTGVTHLDIVDSDMVAPSNLNRQLMATVETIGQPKVEVLRDRLMAINPEATIVPIQDIYTSETSQSFHLEQYDYIIDAIDSLAHKAHLLFTASRTSARVFSSMGAALKFDITKIQVAEFRKVKGCPLGAALRRRMKKLDMMPASKIMCVFSEELLANKGNSEESDLTDTNPLFNKVNHNGTVMHAVATFGLVLAGLVIGDICKTYE